MRKNLFELKPFVMRFLRFLNRFCPQVTQPGKQSILPSQCSPTLSIWFSSPEFQRQTSESCRNDRLFVHPNWWAHECWTFYQLNCSMQRNHFIEVQCFTSRNLVFYFVVESTNWNPYPILHCKFWIVFDQGPIHILGKLKWLSVGISNVITCFWQKNYLLCNRN